MKRAEFEAWKRVRGPCVMRMRIRGGPIESDMAHVKYVCSFVARIFVAQSMEEAFAAKYVLALSDSAGNGYAEYGSNVVKMSSSETKHVVIRHNPFPLLMRPLLLLATSSPGFSSGCSLGCSLGFSLGLGCNLTFAAGLLDAALGTGGGFFAAGLGFTARAFDAVVTAAGAIGVAPFVPLPWLATYAARSNTHGYWARCLSSHELQAFARLSRANTWALIAASTAAPAVP